jgi:hypothetical protein
MRLHVNAEGVWSLVMNANIRTGDGRSSHAENVMVVVLSGEKALKRTESFARDKARRL